MRVLNDETKNLSCRERMRIFSYASLFLEGKRQKSVLQTSFDCVREMIVEAGINEISISQDSLAVSGDLSCSYPLRLNWCGTWTDTPPYCLENGGAVINAAVKINGILPVNVSVEKISEKKVILEFFDSGYRAEYYDAADLVDFTDYMDPFILLKAALVACGIIYMKGESYSTDLFENFSTGLHLKAGVKGIPKGSGLGTSSMLLAACIAAISKFFGAEIENEDLYRRVLLAEQLMDTGGGWQDQAGGLTPGIKIASSSPGNRQNVRVVPLAVPQSFFTELSERLCLVYSGQRRLGRNVLRKIMSGYIQNNPLFKQSLEEIGSLAPKMKNSIENNDFDSFICNLNRQTELTRKLDSGYINDRLDEILLACEELTEGRMICGAGGGGFIQIILKKGYTKEDLSRLLLSTFPEQGVDIWSYDFC